ncbi:plasmid recombination protein [Photobacterium sanguinicancri]|uniref:plasmid recombination protein n=1 Tax=Photobacterium sanguinicancri TaxID=875932 RepID=UPI000A78B51C|nr:plasmid recombination protein [Photobacterium sanguinicancri]
MSGYQFIRIEIYAKVSNKKGKPAMQSIVNEAMRVDGFCPHVYRPQPPQILLGLDPRKLPQIALERTKKVKDKQGRKVRKDAPLLLAGVISLGAESDVNFRDFLKQSIGFLRNKYGANLMSAVLHVDEEHPHIHFYVIPSVIDGCFSMSEIHDGIRARNECKGGYSKKAHAYKQAMREFQDSYYDEVGSKLGLTRLGPRVQRLTRKEWKAQQKQAQKFLQQHRELNKQRRQVTKDEAVLANEKQAIKRQECELTMITGASFFSNKHEKKNEYLRKRLNKLQQQNIDMSAELGEKQQGITKLYREMKSLKQDHQAYQHKFDAMSYKLELKDQFIQQLKLKTGRQYEEKYTRNQQYTCHP